MALYGMKTRLCKAVERVGLSLEITVLSLLTFLRAIAFGLLADSNNRWQREWQSQMLRLRLQLWQFGQGLPGKLCKVSSGFWMHGRNRSSPS